MAEELKIDFAFACRDDCLERMVPSDLRALVRERDDLRAQLPSQFGEAVAMRQRFSQIEDEIMAGKHTAASVFTQMRTAALYTHPADQVADDLTMVKVPRELLEEIVELHRRRGVVLIIHVEQLAELLEVKP